ncbi:outer membrane channel protein [Desulfosarcina widdelii]|uniref:Outer membrane channel protein n=2 Tax=Desulfosarcina widdelii TaxID=947919 RepID=A0A5K7Z6J8_9BACT|nr:outer membrane channel protein [Desulfosarcina widdelii]
MKIGDETEIDLGFRLQTQFISWDNKGGTTGDSEQLFNVRRARLRLGGKVTKWMNFFLQTEKGGGADGSGYDMRLIDAFVTLNLHPLAHIYMGENMAPAGRQHTTSSGALMAIDRPGITNYNLTWGLNGRFGFNNASLTDGNLALSNDESVRDNGATLFGSSSVAEMFHFKYYFGVYDGIQASGEDKERYTARLQVNLFDAEPGYYNSSTYLGKKRTVGLGVSYDTQDDIATDAVQGATGYTWYSVDVFADLPLGPGAATLEAAYSDLDLDDATQLNDGTGSQNALETQGNGWYAQAGYYFESLKLQPWVGYEKWESDAADGTGGWDGWKAGLTYFFDGHNANIKAGYESVKTEQPIGGSNEDTINSFIVGFYITY